MKISKKFRKFFSVGMIALLVLSLMAPAYAAPAPALERKGSHVDLRTISPQLLKDKISPELEKKFEKEEFVTYLIKMKEQVDTEAVSKQAMSLSAAKKETPAVSKMSVRNTVISSLRETSNRTQASLINYLDQMVAKGEVKEYESFYIVNAMAVTSTKKVMEQIAQRHEVEKLRPNQEYFLDQVEKSATETKDKEKKNAKTQLETQADIQNNHIEWNIERVGAPQVWEMGIDGSGVVVANMDTGVELTHPALQRKWRGYDANGNIVNRELHWFDAHSGAALPTDTHGHGTHVMGTSVGSEENGTNMIGVAPGAKWIAVRIFNPSTTDQIILRGGEWILAPRDSQGNLHPEMAPDVVTNSWGGGPGIDEWFRPIVQAWRAAQIFPEFSAGNVRVGNPGGPGSVATPANYPESFAVGATDINNNLANFSLRGPSPYGELKPEVVAPGVNIRSSVPGGTYEGGWNGTSMSGPHVSGLVALLLQVNSSLTVDQLEEIIESTAIPLTNSEYPNSPNNGFGYGLINSYDAVMSILSGLGSVSGRVTTVGDDFDPPVLEHTPVTMAYTGFDIPLTARVSDGVGVVTVEAFARTKGSTHWTFIPMTRTSGDYKDGIYQGNIPYFLVQTAGVEYYIRVNDYGNNGFQSPTYSIEVSNGVTPGYFQDFENDAIGFESGGQNNTWAWGVPTSGPGSAYSGNKLIATNLSGNYANSSNSYMLMPPIDLLESEGAFLSFKHWYDLETNYDFGVVFVAAESTDYQFTEVARFNGVSNGWKSQIIDLSAYAGQQVFVLFNLFTDGSVAKAGWYIDDIALHGPDNVPPAAPANLTAETNAVGTVSLNWSPVTDADLKEYKVYRSTVSGQNYELLGSTAGTSFTDGQTENGVTYYYVVKAIDYSGNLSAPSNEVSVTISGPVVIFSDDFEGDNDNGWTHGGTNDDWQRGVPTAGPSGAYSGQKVWATNLSGDYRNSSNFHLVSPAIDLTAVDNALLSFYHWYEIETNYDKGFVEISTNGGQTWTQLGMYTHSTNGRQWAEVTHNISDYAGQTVQVRFRVTSDGSVVKKGWYIDNFKVLTLTDAGTLAKVGKEKEYTAPDLALKQKVVYTKPQFTISRTEKAEMPTKAMEGSADLQALPALATVTVLETGRSVKSDPSNGRYNMVHAAGDFTLRAEAYGYYPQEKPVTIVDNGNTTVNFNLQAIPHGTITGTVTDERSGEPIAGATVMVREDARISPTTTDENGSFTLEVLEGDYTLVVTAAEYYNGQATIHVPGNETVVANVTLKPFIGYAGEIAYDDGVPENARAFYDAGNGWAVRMSPEAGSAQVVGAKFRFWDTSWPTPGGTAFKYAVYDASGSNGAPGRLLAGPFDGTAVRNGNWTEVNFAEPVMVEGDFYIAYIQATPHPNAPGLATDESSTNALRSWQLVGGVWSQSPAQEGNYMIRALVQYPVGAPVITSPANNTFTNIESVTVTGTSSANGATIKLYNGQEEAGTGVVENGQFSIETTLHAGQNQLSVEAVVNGKITDRSAARVITLDQAAPELTVTTPAEGDRTNQEVVHVTGTTSDEHFASLWVNGQQVTVGANGAFAHRVLVNAGENIITVKALDLAGNESLVTRTVYVDLDAPEIQNITPVADVHLRAGETLQVSFDSAEGLQAAFRIELPLGLSSQGNQIMMTETSPGHYEGTWTTPENLNVSGAIIVVRVWDQAGNATEAQASGKLYVTTGGGGSGETKQAPNAVIRAADSAKQKKQTTFDGSQSSDADGQIVKYEWNFGDGNSATGATVKHSYKNPGTYTVTLTVTDNDGLTHSVTHTIVITK